MRHLCTVLSVCIIYNLHGLSIDEVEKSAKQIDYSDRDSDNSLYVYLGIDYIPQEIIKLFEKLSGIEVIVSIFDSNETLETKMLAGGAQYDIVFPTAFPCFNRQLHADIYHKLDKTKIDMKVFDEYIISKLASFDTYNEYCIPFQWGISGLGINEEIVRKLLPNVNLDSYAVIFDEENVKQLSKRGVSVYESHEELFPAVAAYLGLDPENLQKDDVEKIANHLRKIRKYIGKFTGYGFEDLSCGGSCVVLSTSGDITSVRNQQLETKNHSSVKFILPKEGASLWIDVAAIPHNAKHIKNAHLFLKFLTNPCVSAWITNITYRATAVKAASKYIIPQILNNKYIYPDSEVKSNCYIEKYAHTSLNKVRTRELTKIKSGL